MRQVVLAVFLLLPAMPLDAHPLNVGYAEITLHDREVVIALSLNLFEFDLLVGLDRNQDARVDQEELEAKQAAILDYLRGKISVSAGGEMLPMAAGQLKIGRGIDGKPLLRLGNSTPQEIADDEDRAILLADIAAEPWFGLPVPASV